MRSGARRLAALLLAALLALGAVACGGDDPEVSQDTVAADEDATTTTVDPHEVTVATTEESVLDVYAEPDAPQPDHRVHSPEGEDVPLTFLVRQEQGDWLNVDLPERPNGSTGWIKRDDVELQTHNFRIEVRLEEFNIKVFEGDDVILDAEVGVARDNTPSPGGEYYTTSLLQPPDPDTVYGTYAYGISAFSETLETFAGGPGQLGIHGTNDDSTIGTEVSHGCIRLHNEDIEQLVPVLPLGVPVEIIA